MFQITSSVGKGGKNLPNDVMAVQKALNASPLIKPNLVPDGRYGKLTFRAIVHYQMSIFQQDASCDGRIDPLGKTLRMLNSSKQVACRKVTPAMVASREAALGGYMAPAGGEAVSTQGGGGSKLTDADFKAAAATLGKVEIAMIRAFAEVESGGRSGFGPTGFPVVVFEGHVFRRVTKSVYDVSHPQLSYAYVKKAGPEWQKNNANQATSIETLKAAAALDVEAAYRACSWGMFQVLGENYRKCGFATVTDFVAALKTGERAHLDAFVGFCQKTPGLVDALVAKNYATCARLYNGNDYGTYDQKIQNAYKKYAAAA